MDTEKKVETWLSNLKRRSSTIVKALIIGTDKEFHMAVDRSI
jgi:hypothetical protein